MSAYALINEGGRSPYVLVCEHASRFIPPRYNGLGLPEADLMRHIAWDIGAGNVARHLSQNLDAALLLARYSRLLIDLNRPPRSATSIPPISETTVIPGNANLTNDEVQHRINTMFVPFQSRLSEFLNQRKSAARPAIIIAVHSFTPVFKNVARPWHAGILFRRSRSFGAALAKALGGAAAMVAENQPYQIEDESDYTVPVHGEARGLDAVLVEIRQDLIANDDAAQEWAGQLATALESCQPELDRPVSTAARQIDES